MFLLYNHIPNRRFGIEIEFFFPSVEGVQTLVWTAREAINRLLQTGPFSLT
jgi:hypothetical protein